MKKPLTIEDWNRSHSKAARIIEALQGGARTRAQLLAAAGGSVQGLQTVLQRLVAEGRVARVRPGTYALAS